LESETFQKILNKISTNFSNGTYNMEDVSSLTTTVSGVIDNLANSDGLNEKTKNELKIVSEALGCMKNKQDIDVNRLIGVISSMNLSN
jgi:tape measure domain-containing protein